MVTILKDIIGKCSGLNIDEKRSIADDYVEIVFLNKEIGAWRKVLTDTLGPEIKPAGVEPTESELDLTKDFGGIRGNQTLFKKAFDDVIVIAILWPWQDGVRTTLKIALFKNG